MQYSVQFSDGLFIVSDPDIGTLSLFNDKELFAFELLNKSMFNFDKLENFIKGVGCIADPRKKASLFMQKLKDDGWLRHNIPVDQSELLEAIYLTITRECNLSCCYCFQGLNNRSKKSISLINTKIIVQAIAKINKRSKLSVTGGEPFIHDHFFDILDIIEQANLQFSIVTNGTLVDATKAERLSKYHSLLFVQVSIDGITEKTHALTRGKTFRRCINGITALYDAGVPFVLSPTIHNGNIHELYEIAHFAVAHGGFISPNPLTRFPHDNNDEFELDFDLLTIETNKVEDKLLKEFDRDYILKCKSLLHSADVQDLMKKRKNTCCGMGRSTINIDWNGDIFPCHLLNNKKLKLGNALGEDLDLILSKDNKNYRRTHSFDIPKCKKCLFVATCGGGCRASSYYEHDTFLREDSNCDFIYNMQMKTLFSSYFSII